MNFIDFVRFAYHQEMAQKPLCMFERFLRLTNKLCLSVPSCSDQNSMQTIICRVLRKRERNVERGRAGASAKRVPFHATRPI